MNEIMKDTFLIEYINMLISLLKKNENLSTKDLAVSYYSFRELYNHRQVLFNILCNIYSDSAWKTKKHFDGTMHSGSFLAGISTPLGEATYHIKMSHFSEFDCKEMEQGPFFDNYTPDDVLMRLNALPLIGNAYIQTNETTKYNPSLLETSQSDEDMQQLAELLSKLLKQLRKMNLLHTTAISDGYHDLKLLYRQKREMFKVICHNYKDWAWKSFYDTNGEPFGEDVFFVGIYTPNGPAGYILNQEYFNDFEVVHFPFAPIAKANVYDNVLENLASIPIRKAKKKHHKMS